LPDLFKAKRVDERLEKRHKRNEHQREGAEHDKLDRRRSENPAERAVY
jgi:hypothetical protein